MGASGFPIDLVLFGMIAAFLVLRLRSILGKRWRRCNDQSQRGHHQHRTRSYHVCHVSAPLMFCGNPSWYRPRIKIDASPR